MYKGQPFVPVAVIPIDMFPHTNRCEVIFVYERLNPVTNAESDPADKKEKGSDELGNESVE